MPAPPKPAKEAPLPKALPACCDLLYKTREDRLKIQKQVDELAKLETRLKERFINELSKAESKGMSGKIARVSIEIKHVPQVKDWDAFYKHIKKTGDFTLLGRSLSKAAVQEQLDAKKVLPGIEIFDAVTVSCVKA